MVDVLLNALSYGKVFGLSWSQNLYGFLIKWIGGSLNIAILVLVPQQSDIKNREVERTKHSMSNQTLKQICKFAGYCKVSSVVCFHGLFFACRLIFDQSQHHSHHFEL